MTVPFRQYDFSLPRWSTECLPGPHIALTSTTDRPWKLYLRSQIPTGSQLQTCRRYRSMKLLPVTPADLGQAYTTLEVMQEDEVHLKRPRAV